MDDNSERATLSFQFTLGGLFLWLSLVFVALGYQLMLASNAPPQWDVISGSELLGQVGIARIAWLNGSCLCVLVILIGNQLRKTPIAWEPGIILMLAIGLLQLPSSIYASCEILLYSPPEHGLFSIDQEYLRWGNLISDLLQALLFIWAVWHFRRFPNWMTAFGMLGLLRGLAMLHLATRLREPLLTFPFPVATTVVRVLFWGPLVVVIGAAIYDLARQEKRSWLHWLSVVTWFVSFSMAIGTLLGLR